MSQKDEYIALLESFGYVRTTNPTELCGLRYLEDVRSDGGSCVLRGDGTACCEATKTGAACTPGCCCQDCFCPEGNFLGHCCCCKCPPCANAKP